MVFSNQEEIVKLIKNPKNKTEIVNAVKHHERLKFHAETIISVLEANTYLNDFLSNAKVLLPDDKYEMFKTLLRFPLPTTAIIDTVKDHYSKVFEAKDAFFDVKAENDEHREMFNALLEGLNEDSFWRNKALDAICDEPSLILVCDKPSSDEKGEYKPYFYTLPIEKVIDVGVDSNNNIEYLIFPDFDSEEVEYIAVIDSEKYIRVDVSKDNNGENTYFISGETPHGLDYVPARFLGTEPLYKKTKIIQKSPLSPILGLLDEYLYKYVGKQHLDLYSAFPIYWMYAIDEDGEIEDEKLRVALGELYDGYEQQGLLPTIKDNIRKARGLKNIIGAGTLMEIPTPVDGQDADLREPIGIIRGDIESLKYNASELESIESKIINIATGKVERASKMDRTNEKAVSSQFEGERDVLIYISNQLSIARAWLWDTLGKLYIPSQYKKATCSYGTEFFIEDETQAINNFQEYKKAGASQTMIAHRAEIFRQVAAKNRPTMKLRLKILESIEPYPLLDIEQCVGLWNQGVINGLDLDVKIRFKEYVDRFEREVGEITVFDGNNEQYNGWIGTIKDKIYSYGTTIERPKVTNGTNAVGVTA